MVISTSPKQGALRALYLSRRTSLTLGSLILGCILATHSLARDATKDRLWMPPLTSQIAQQSLMLDITQAGDRLVAVGDRGYILFSDDLGETWQQANSPSSSTLTAITFANNKQGWTIGHDGIVLTSNDGGTNWKKQLDGNQINEILLISAQINFLKAQELAKDTTKNADPEIDTSLILEEAEISLEDLQIAQEEGPTTPLLDLWFKDANYGIIVGAYGTLLITEDAGENWSTPTAPPINPDRFHLNAITYVGNNTLILAGEAGSLYRSQDNGQHWETIESPYNGSFFGVAQQPDRSIILFGLRGNTFVSNDQGMSWKTQKSNTQASLFASTQLPNGTTLLGAANGQLISSQGNHQPLSILKQKESRPISAMIAMQNQLFIVGAGGISTQQLPHDTNVVAATKTLYKLEQEAL
ncbi:WD40/YVTN/BNR-like repeat-containing protein [Neptunomonas japonica]|uniref:Photosynthesis system II assembly factor Ycf48/Hcf136-like domain-containing protein n=1 Tax=Neptunomonas japonica JAMM 1380 TaxID=1441457 RepID=A0A7R6SWH5_9GAMM|nr:YCF48-related protein [Neptunomonas japonica]BBB30490.1 conserved hypothetical protein [Neptunomonas japonica JAMM 1380]